MAYQTFYKAERLLKVTK